MARFNGVRQGVAEWLWAIVIAIIVAILVAIASTQFTALQSIGGLPQLPISGNALTIGGIIAALAASLIGAIPGGLAGMRYHRTIDLLSTPSKENLGGDPLSTRSGRLS